MGAAAALVGLIFVAVSINIDEILCYPWLPGRAGAAIAIPPQQRHRDLRSRRVLTRPWS